MKPIITVFESIHSDGLDKLLSFADVRVALGATREEQLVLSEISVAIIIKSVVQVDSLLLDSAPKLRVVARAGTGVDNINLEEADKRGIKILTVPGGNSISAAEFTIFQILFLCRRMNEVIRSVNKNDYRRHLLEGRELQNMTVGIVGLGNVGMAVFERLKVFGCKIIGYDPESKNINRFQVLGGMAVDTLEDMLPNIDILSLHARLTFDNHHMVGRNQFDLMKDGLLLVNSARATLVDESALFDAIESGKVIAAALDVIDPEPPFDLMPNKHSYSHQLLEHPQVMVTPHIGASTVDAQRQISLNLAKQIREALA